MSVIAVSVARRLYRHTLMQPRPATHVQHAQPGLVLVPSRAIDTPGTSGSTSLQYVAGAVGSPVSVATAVFAACAGLGFAGLYGAMVALLAVIGIAALCSRSETIRRHLDAQAELRERCRREAQRLKQLRPTGPVRQQQYIELRDLVEQVERIDAAEAERFELQDLLDHFVRLSLYHQRCLEAIRLAGSHDLPQTIPIGDASRTKRRREILARRLKHREECLARVDRLADEIDAVDELVRLVAQRVACPAMEPELEREIERRLWELDEVDAALRQLSA
jgi:flagellar motility protein MotE (MotC chaperone)